MESDDRQGFQLDEMRGHYISAFIELETILKDIISRSLADQSQSQNRIKRILLAGRRSYEIIKIFEGLTRLVKETSSHKELISQLNSFNKLRNLFAHSRGFETPGGTYIFHDYDRLESLADIKTFDAAMVELQCIEMMQVCNELRDAAESLSTQIRKAIDAE